jgi:DNA invertase Pin-like site-specific DNA recombinase
MGKAMFTIIGAMAELESSLIQRELRREWKLLGYVQAVRGGPTTPAWFVTRIEELADTTDMSIRQIQNALKGKVSKSVVREIVKRVREQSQEVPL